LKRASFIAVLGVAAWGAAGCAVPLAPGYTIEKQKIEVTYSKVTPDRVSVRAWYRMTNTGTLPLEEIHFSLPFKSWTENLHAEWGRQSLLPQGVAGAEMEISTHLNAPWNQKERKELVLTFDLKIVNAKLSLGGDRGSLFYLPSGGWYPNLLPPHVMLAQGGTPPDKWDLVVSVPAGYRVHASGTQRGQDRSENRNNAGSSYRFEQRLETDFAPFVVAGPYMEVRVHSGPETVFLWSGQSLPESRAQEIGERFGEEAAYFSAEFGLKDATRGQAWIIECPGGSGVGYVQPGEYRTGGQSERWKSIVDCQTVPQSAFAPLSFETSDIPGSFVAPAQADTAKKAPPFPSLDVQLAATWFTFAVGEGSEGPKFPMAGVPDYMALSFNMLKNPSKRGDYVRQLIGRVDSDPEGAKETLESAKNVEIARIRSELFYLALEDRCGEVNLHHALARILRILRGKTWDVGDLRSAMEAECGADLADFFRQWLNRPGIPEEFRARYLGIPIPKPTAEKH
jgi:hypothetical protein